MKKILILIIVTFSISCYSQWTYNTGKSDFDGSYRTASVYVSGGEFPYTKPVLVVNKFEKGSMNVYISNAGYSGCSNNIIYLKFNDDEKIYETNYSGSGSNNDSWFLSSFYELEDFELLEKMMNHSSMSARLKSSCGYSDYKFSLGGSTKAINFVLGKDWFKQKKDELVRLKLLEGKLLDEQRKEDSISNVNLNKSREKLSKNDSIYRAKKEEKILTLIADKKQKEKEAILKCKKYVNKYLEKDYDCYLVIEKTGLRKVMRDFKNIIPIEEGILILVDKNFKNKAFYKVIDHNNFGPTKFYILKKYVKSISKRNRN